VTRSGSPAGPAGDRPGATTAMFALLGSPVAHSLSPALHNAAFAAAGLDAVYVALACAAGSVDPLMRALAEAGGGGNVTLPHKAAAFAALDRPTDAARATGACNTFWAEDGALAGDNTDVDGFGSAARALLDPWPEGGFARVIGAGGAARAAAYWLGRAGWRVVVEGRTPARVAELVDALAMPGVRAGSGDVEGCDLLVNATPLGLDPADPPPLEEARLARAGAVLDMTYAASPNALERASRARGVPYADGREMLVRQAAAAWPRWFGRDAPIQAMRGALDAAT
jgi:shikimate dehydrogenase